MSQQDKTSHSYDIADTGVIHVTGADAETFLQAQLTNDVNALDTRHWQRSAYCNPKGRVIAVLEITREDDGFWVTTHTELLQPLVKRLSMYVLRAKVEFNVLESIKSIGLGGESIGVLIEEQWREMADENFAIQWQDDVLIRRIGASQQRLVLTGPEKKLSELQQQLGTVCASAPDSEWRRLNILDGIPGVWAATSEEFTPQALNLDLLDGVSFNKGCYPGQEIVARMHFLGKSKQRMHQAKTSGNVSLKPGDPVYREDHEQRMGTVVDAICDESGCDALISTNRTDDEKGYADPARTTLLEWRDLPYTMAS